MSLLRTCSVRYSEKPGRSSSALQLVSLASDGTVCRMPVAPITTCPSRRRRAARIPSGIANSSANPSEIATSLMCSTLR